MLMSCSVMRSPPERVHQAGGQSVIRRVRQVDFHGEPAIAQPGQDDWQRKGRRHEAEHAAPAGLIDDDLDVRLQLAALVDELHVQRYPAANAAGAVEARLARPCVPSPRSRRMGSWVSIRRGRGRLHTSHEEATSRTPTTARTGVQIPLRGGNRRGGRLPLPTQPEDGGESIKIRAALAVRPTPSNEFCQIYCG